ncbi:metallophosphoesterase [Neobacillus mesonae]|nr:metallophosphoesterase [Neobacillus mesonae]
MGRLFVTSDIHGYGFLLEKLLYAAKYDAKNDQLYLLGDYVNKGPDSCGTLDLVMQLCNNGAIALQGNNERKWLKEGPTTVLLTDQTMLGYRQFISQLPLWAEDTSYLFVHAGIRPGVPLSAQSPEDLTEIRETFHHSPPLKEKVVVFGHTSTFKMGLAADEIWQGNGKIGIDTGAGHGHYVSLVDLSSGIHWLVPVKRPYLVSAKPLTRGYTSDIL